MRSNLKPIPRVAYVASFPPRECGIATFTCDLAEAIQDQVRVPAFVVAINERAGGYPYDARVRGCITRDDCASYRDAAWLVAKSPVDIINVQHEYGLFGGDWGEYLVEFYRHATQPIVTTLHTVLPNPDPTLRRVTRALAEYSARVVVLADAAVDILARDYGISRGCIRMIPHGVPTITPSPGAREQAKAALGYTGRMILSTFGLINPNKGIEYALRALPEIARQHPNVLYLIIGETHPGVRAHQGENYRAQLQQLVRELDLDTFVEFADRYMTLEQLVQYLQATDIYLVPYLNPHQIVSGTLAYAVGTGKAIIATPMTYAREVLADGRGILVPFRNSDAIASAVNRLLSDPIARARMEQRTFEYSRNWTWRAVGAQYINLFTEVLRDELPASVPRSLDANDRFSRNLSTRDLYPARSPSGVHAG
jgi:glycosyltransferase involved in cell wall biosynthesis